ncbi:RNA-directed DNA polymerase [Pectobacterium brasiliense]|uniref:antiviral reverse transcriptase Drt3a n=1 Tax=Pectobacterium brasiliense TaxID=180957 RepID=UPI00069A98EA|nr:antiviral reverse transcriptase Drt3a [Pectobacterium brasiliense]MCG5047144.1 RNA-directed DNA polymerase [Pectobacterium brasiliense]
MLNQSISYKSIKLLGKNTWIKFDPKVDYNSFVSKSFGEVEKNFINGEYIFSIFNYREFNGKKGYDFSKAADELVCKKLNDNIRRLFKVKPSDRHEIVKQTISLAKDSQPITIARLDIKDFYESIDRKAVIKFVSEEWLLSQQNRAILKQWDKQLEMQDVVGLPRGMSLSSTLSEIKIRNFDRAMKYERGVYFYARYVDDIIIFYSGGVDDIKNILLCNLRKTASELMFNENKSKFYSLNEITLERFLEIDYLGYKILIEPNPKNNKAMRKVKVLISDKKVNKIKFRIRRSFCSYVRDRNFKLLSYRLKFLSGNQYIIGDIERTKLKSGIYYNYPLITDFDQLNELDFFYRKLLFCSMAPICTAIKMIKNHGGSNSYIRYNQIKSISFKFGFHKRIMNDFSTKTSKKIKRCW